MSTKTYYAAYKQIEDASSVWEFQMLIKKIRTSEHLTEDERSELEHKCLLAHGDVWFGSII